MPYMPVSIMQPWEWRHCQHLCNMHFRRRLRTYKESADIWIDADALHTTHTDLASCVCVCVCFCFLLFFFLWWSWCIFLHWCWWWRRYSWWPYVLPFHFTGLLSCVCEVMIMSHSHYPSKKGVSRIPGDFKTWTQMSACTISSIDRLFHINVV